MPISQLELNEIYLDLFHRYIWAGIDFLNFNFFLRKSKLSLFSEDLNQHLHAPNAPWLVGAQGCEPFFIEATENGIENS